MKIYQAKSVFYIFIIYLHIISVYASDNRIIDCTSDDIDKTKVSLVEYSKYQVSSGDCKFGQQATLFSIGDPVHEEMTEISLKEAGLKYNVNYIRGVFWNDDPCSQLFFSFGEFIPSFGISWLSDFHDAGKLSLENNNNFSDLSCEILGDSHFGNLQYLHAMTVDEKDKINTLKNIINWIEFTYKVAIGEINVRKKLSDIQLALNLKPYLYDDINKTVSQLFSSTNQNKTKMRAIGSVLHIIQDSYAKGHVERSEIDLSVIKFLSYTNQDHNIHESYDAWAEGDDLNDKINMTPGAIQAIDASTEVLKYYQQKADWVIFKKYLLENVFIIKA